jgi:hypothetical protein
LNNKANEQDLSHPKCTNFLYDNKNQMCYISGDKCYNNAPHPDISNISNNVVHYTKKV